MRILLCSLLVVLFSCSHTSSRPDAPLVYQHINRKFQVDTTVSPCQDYHAHICNRVEREFKLPADRSAYFFAFSDSMESLLTYKKQYFANLEKITAQNAREQKLKDAYLACMNPTALKADEEAYVAKIKAELSVPKDRQQLLKYLASKVLSGDAGLVDYFVLRNMDRPDYHDLVLLPNTMTFPERSYYAKPEAATDLIAVMTLFFDAMGVVDAQKRAQQLYDYEKGFAQLFPMPNDLRDLINKRTATNKAQLLKLKNLALAPLLAQVPSRTHFRSIAPAALAYMDQALGEMPEQQLRDFYLYYALKDVLDESQPKYFAKHYELEAKYMGASPVRPVREERCTSYVMRTFPMELDAILWERIFPNFPRQSFISLTETIRASLLATLKENKWLSAKAKAGAIKKMSQAQLLLVAPENERQWNFNPETLVTPGTKVTNDVNLRAAKRQRDFQELATMIPRDRWEMGPLTVNAYYDASLNHFVVPVAILQAPFFDVGQSHIQNLAAIGSVIGHELGHGIDDKGYLYDEVGRLRSWVTPRDKSGLEVHSRPLVNLFNGVGHNGKLTLGENTGDNVGLAASFRSAFPDYTNGKYSQAKLQEFYQQYARAWCEVQTDSFKEMRLKVDAHSLGKERINQQVRQQEGFYEAYGCQEKDALYLAPAKRVKIW